MPSCCKECVDFLGEFLDGELAPEEAREFQEHLEMCPPCVAFLDTYKKTSSVCREKLAVTMPAELSSTILGFLKARLRSPE